MYTLPSIRSAGTYDSSTLFPSMQQSPERNVTEFELELFYQDGGVSILNGREYPICRGMLLIACPGDKRTTILPFRNHFIRLNHADEPLALLIRGLCGVTMLENIESGIAIFERISSHFLSDDPYSRSAAAAEIYSLLQLVHTQGSQRALLEPREGDVVQQAQAYIEAHYQEAFGVEELARVCHVSAPYLHRLFAVHLNTTPHQALMRRRLIAAKVMLINESASIANIAWKCGFQSASYFSDCFRRNVGMSPRKFRKETEYQL